MQLWRFSKEDYVYLQHEVPKTLNVKVRRTILCIKNELYNGILLLEGKNGQEY